MRRRRADYLRSRRCSTASSREQAAKIDGMDRQTLRDWVIRFNAQGPDGLVNKSSSGAALVLPACNSEAMQLHLDEIATKVTRGAHAIVLFDQAGWHGGKVLEVPSNISLMSLPPRAPELNGEENIRQFMRQNWLSTGSSNPLTISRSLLLGLEHAHRSALEDHVRRAPRLGDVGYSM